jgi:hypothetical protein
MHKTDRFKQHDENTAPKQSFGATSIRSFNKKSRTMPAFKYQTI